jgi:hypothetical protein
MSLEITFLGREADRHQVEANDGLESLAGFAHAATLVAHYVATGKVRQRYPYDDGLKFYFQNTKPGSLTAVLAVGGTLAAGAAGNLVYDLLKAVWKKATGTGDEGDIKIGDQTFKAGDLDALTEAVTPSLLRGHTWIDGSQQQITIKKGSQLLVDFSKGTKSYLKDEVPEEGRSQQDVSVAALNANSKHGRVFFFDLGRTIPFKVDPYAIHRTTSNLSRYLTQYVDNTGATVNIKFQKIFHSDGRLKRIIIHDCYGIEGLS